MANEFMTIGNYHIIKEIARGTAGRVYMARHIHLTHRIVAIKLLHMAHVSSPQERQDFLQEASFLDLLKHPYILPVYDVSTHDGYPYIVAEYAHNGSLKERIRANAPNLLSEEEVRKMLAQVGQALFYAHERNIVHRDLKPANILFNANGDALLADFSIALKLDATSTQLADASGTPYYMAPEQFEGIISKKSDQYALGCIAYELVTGQRPFTALDWRALAYKHAREIPIAPSRFNPQLPGYVDEAILRAMAKDRADRFEDVASFLAALQLPVTLQGGVAPLAQANPVGMPPSQFIGSSTLPLENTPHTYTPIPPSMQVSQPSVMSQDNIPTYPAYSALPTGPMPPSAGVPPQTDIPTFSGSKARPTGPLPSVSAQVNIPTVPAIHDRVSGQIPVPSALQQVGSTTDSFKTIDEQESLPTQASRGLGAVDVSAYPTLQGGPVTPMPPPAVGTPGPNPLAGTAPLSASGPIQIPPPPPMMPTGGVSRKRAPRGRLILVAVVAIALLVGGGMVYAFAIPKGNTNTSVHKPQNINTTLPTTVPTPTATIPPVTSGASVTITPSQQNLTKNYTIFVVTGIPDASQNQVAGARLLTASGASQTKTVNATGSKGGGGTHATGTIRFENYNNAPLTFSAGATFENRFSPDITVVLNTSVTVPANDPKVANISIADVSVHVSQVGPIGNIPGYNAGAGTGFYACTNCANPVTSLSGWKAYNVGSFSGGTNSSTVTVVQQSDIDGAAHALESGLSQNAQNALQGQLGAGEQMIGSPKCSPSVSSNHHAGDVANNVTVTVTEKCTGEAYTQQNALSLAAGLFRNDAASASYKLAGSVVTSVLQVNGVVAGGAVSLVVQAGAPVVFQFSDAARQKLRQLIVGKSEQDAQQLLMQQTGVGKVTISLPSGLQTLPSDPGQITITIVGG